MAWIPLVLAGIQAAGAASNAVQGAQKKTVEAAAPPAGGTGQMNPVGDLIMQLGGQDPGAKAPPAPVQTPEMAPQQVTPPPTTSLPTTQDAQNTTAPGNKDMSKRQEIGDLLASIPDALAAASDMLGLNHEKRKELIPSSGSVPQNQYSQAFGGLPRPPSLGEILAALPRPGGR